MKQLFSRYGQLNLALASLARVPGFCLSVILTLSLTLAALFVVLSLVNTYFLKPLPVLDENRLVVIEQTTTFDSGSYSGFQSYQPLVHWYRNSRSIEMPVLVSAEETFTFSNIEGEPPHRALFVSGNYFTMLKVPMLLGHGFKEDAPLGTPDRSVVVSERFWRTYLDADPDVIGRQLTIDQEDAFEVRGVVSERFSVPYMIAKGKVDVWLPMGEDKRYFNSERWQSPWDNTFKDLKLLALLKPGVTLEQAQIELKERIDELKDQWTAIEGIQNLTPYVHDYRSVELGNKDNFSLLMLAGVIGLTLIALVNVTNLFLSRAVARHKTLALQAVLGAKRRVLFKSLLTEAGILVVTSVLLALLISAWGIKLFKHLAADHMPLVNSVAIDINLVLQALAICLVLAYLFAYIATRVIDFKSLRGQIQSSGKGAVGQLSGRAVKGMIGLQMLLASILILFAVGVFSKALETTKRPTGLEHKNRYATRLYINNDKSELPERADRREKLQALLKEQPWVRQVAIGQSPVNRRQAAQSLNWPDGTSTAFFPGTWIGPNYFEMSGLQLIAGRKFSEAAYRGEKHEMLVSESTALALKPDGQVLGMVFKGLGGKEHEIVGITEDFNHPTFYAQDKGKHIWWPDLPYSYGYVVETTPGYELTRTKLLALAQQIDQRLKVWQLFSLESEMDAMLYLDRLTQIVSSVLALFTLLLASIGIYGVLSYNLAFKRSEYGLRMALGANSRRLYQLVTRQTLMPLLAGLGLALALCAVLMSIWSGKLAPWVTLNPLLTLTGLTVALTVALYASLWPLKKLLSGRPMAALRDE